MTVTLDQKEIVVDGHALYVRRGLVETLYSVFLWKLGAKVVQRHEG